MTHEHPARRRVRLSALSGAAVALATMAGFLVAAGPPAAAETGTTTTSSVATPTAADCSAAVSGTALARSGWTASSNVHPSSDVPANAFDGNLSTRFSSDEDQAVNLYLELNLGSAQTFDELEMLTPNSPHDYARGYEIEVYTNGSWQLVTSCSGASTPEVVSFPAQTAQYVAIVLTTANNSWWWSIDELYLYTNSASSTTTTSTTTTSSTTTSTTAASTTTTTAPTTTTTRAHPPRPHRFRVTCWRVRHHRLECIVVVPKRGHPGTGTTTTTTSTTTTSTTTTSTTVPSTTTTTVAKHHRHRVVCRWHQGRRICIVIRPPRHRGTSPTTTIS